MNKIYQKSFSDAETCRRKANTDMVAVSDTEAAGDPDTGAVPVVYTNVIPVLTTKVIPGGCSRESQPCKIKKRLRLPTETFGNDQIYKKRTCSKGFTLIELLVVVLIIGILAAVALPQYALAVEKARAREAMVWARHILDAEELYYASEGKYTNELDDLGLKKYNGRYFGQTLPYNVNGAFNIVMCRSQREGAFSYCIRYFASHTPDSPYQGRKLCVTDNARGERLCKSLCAVPKMETYQHMSGHQFCYLD